jgi:carboxyl-terminal processing protease
LQYQTVDRLYRKQEAARNAKDSSRAAVKPFDTLEFKSRQETRKFCTDWFKRWRKMDKRDKISFYVNAITELYDPHTNYFPPEDKANFDISMTGKLEGIGATLTERDGYIKVERIVPGSASYRQGELKAGDLIIKVAQGAAEPVDVVDMKLDDAIQLIRGKKGTEVRLTVKKPDGSIKIIPIIREVVVIEESYARSAIIEFEGKKIGIIQLPSFYADFSEKGRGRHSSQDVYMELLKLQDAGAEGIMLDLRNNGGGSLADAIDMGGLFIKDGPIVQVREPRGMVDAPGDPDPNIVYDGPLLILTNTYSASASEILAAAMQDYKRALIVGSKSTFGKGTVQTFVPIGGGSSADFPKGFGQLKVTIQKFYRINGGTTQLNGVTPDVIIPDIYDGIPQGEREMKHYLAYDKIKPAPTLHFLHRTPRVLKPLRRPQNQELPGLPTSATCRKGPKVLLQCAIAIPGVSI